MLDWSITINKIILRGKSYSANSSYGMMALSTFFMSLTIKAETKPDKCLKNLMLIHGIFFLGCFIMPMTGVFKTMETGKDSIGGIIALEFWCAYFIPIGVLSYFHFKK